MNKSLKYLGALAGVMLSVSAMLPDNSPQAAYIARYAPVAVREMYRSGVPASITLAQGLLESRYGQSRLATEGNNHFGIKCHDWTGAKIYHDDDRKGECFRSYKSADESFRDHSDFLRYRDRYKPLFDNDITDYKSWAKGLKKAGYATDPAYPSKLVKLIEEYRLYEYDSMKPEDFAASEPASGKLSRKERRERKKTEKQLHEKTEVTEKIPESPLEMEEPRKLQSSEAMETFSFSLTRQLYSRNGVPFTYAAAGETYSSIASAYHLFLREILRFNDASSDAALQPGDIVYLQNKKPQTRRGLDKYISDDGGETMRDIAQRFGIRMKDLCKMNGLGAGYVTLPGDELKLRP